MVDQMAPAYLPGPVSCPPVFGTRQSIGGETMTLLPVMWTVWGVLVGAAAILHVYRGSLTKDEEDQIFLDDSFDHEKAAQAAIVAKVNKIEPMLRVAYWLVLAMTIVVIVYYVRDILLHLDIIQ